MPVAEFSAGLTSLRAALDLTKAMIGLRDAEAFRTRSIELQSVIAEALGQVIEAREAHSAQIDRIKALETEVADLKAWDADKKRYELKSVGIGVSAYMLKPEERGTEQPHWLCPNCHAKGHKSFLQASGARLGRAMAYRCSGCQGVATTEEYPEWL